MDSKRNNWKKYAILDFSLSIINVRNTVHIYRYIEIFIYNVTNTGIITRVVIQYNI